VLSSFDAIVLLLFLAEFQHSRIKSELELFQLISGTQYNDKIRMYDTKYENKNIEFLKL